MEMITWCQLGIHDKRVSTLIHIYRSTGLIDVYTHGYLANQQQALFFKKKIHQQQALFKQIKASYRSAC